MSEAETNPETGVDAKGVAQTDDIDIDNEVFTDPEPAEADPDEGDADPDNPSPDDDAEDVELDGKTYRIPKAVKPLLMMQADYTRKTQETAAEARRIFEAATALEAHKAQQAEAFEALRHDHIRVGLLETNHAALTKEADTYRQVDWQTLQQQDPDAYDRHRARQRQVLDTLLDLDQDLKGAKTELTAKEAKRLEDAATAQSADLAKRQQDTGRALKAEIPGWNLEKADAVAKFMVNDLGVEPEEVEEATDARLWKMAYRLQQAEATVAKLTKGQQANKAATTNERAQTASPAARVGGSGGSNPRRTTDASGDKLSTEEWVRRERARVEKLRAAR